MAYRSPVTTQPILTSNDQQYIAAELDRYFIASTLALNPPKLETVALAGQNQGGPVQVAKKVVVRPPALIDRLPLTVPVDFTYISQGFNTYSHPGLDLVAVYGTPIYSAAAGCVQSMSGGYNGGYGDLVILDHGDGYTTRYAHLQRFAPGLTSGSCVDARTLVGYIGLTGRTTGPHLHFELRLNGQPIRPIF